MATPTRIVRLRGVPPELSRAQDNIARTLEPVASAVVATPIGGGPLPQWVNVPLLADFIRVTGQAVPAYHKDALGYVHSKGVVASPAGQAAGTAVYGPLPVGFRPAEPQRLSVRGNVGNSQAIIVGVDGSLKIDVAVPPGGSADLAFSFLADA